MLNKIKTAVFGESALPPYENNPAHLAGDWKFTGYFPKTCKPLPSCHTKHLQLEIQSKTEAGYLFNTSARLAGETCSLKDISFQEHGLSEAGPGKIYYGKERLGNKLAFNWWSKPYYIDEDEKMEKLFILEKKDGQDRCWSTFQKTTEIRDFEAFKSKMLRASPAEIENSAGAAGPVFGHLPKTTDQRILNPILGSYKRVGQEKLRFRG